MIMFNHAAFCDLSSEAEVLNWQNPSVSSGLITENSDSISQITVLGMNIDSKLNKHDYINSYWLYQQIAIQNTFSYLDAGRIFYG